MIDINLNSCWFYTKNECLLLSKVGEIPLSESRFRLLNGIPLPGYVRDDVITSQNQHANPWKHADPMLGQFKIAGVFTYWRNYVTLPTYRNVKTCIPHVHNKKWQPISYYFLSTNIIFDSFQTNMNDFDSLKLIQRQSTFWRINQHRYDVHYCG